MSQGIVVVAYQGCEMQVLACKVAAPYRYTGVTPKQSQLAIHNEDELSAALPLGFASLQGKLAASGRLNVDMTIVGEYAADRMTVERAELEGDECDKATHVIGKLTAGAFRIYTTSSQSAGGGASAVVAEGSASSRQHEEQLSTDGDPTACRRAASTDEAPPEGCGALLRVEVFPIGGSAAAAADCPPGARWNGAQCVMDSCPSGTHREQGQCVEDRGGSPWKTGALVAGLAGVGIGLGAGAWALERKGVVLDHCDDDKLCDSEGSSAASTGKTAATISTVSMALGAGFLTTYFILPGSDSSRLEAASIPGGASLTLGRTF